MPRPRLSVRREVLIEGFEASGSVRGAARFAGVSRVVAARGLLEAGIKLPSRDEAYRRFRLLREVRDEAPPTKVVQVGEEKWGEGDDDALGVSIWRDLRPRSFTACLLCRDEASRGRLCAVHDEIAHRNLAGRCSWPSYCTQDALGGETLCNYHRRRASGELD